MQVQKSAALDRKARRKASNKQRREGGEQLDLTGLQKRAERDIKLRCKLGHTILTGDQSERSAAAKAKRKLNNTWTNRNTHSLTGFWKDQ